MTTATKGLPTIARKRAVFGGAGYIAGVSPGLVTVNGSVAARQVEVRHRTSRMVMTVLFSNPDGTYLIGDLDPTQTYDVIARDYAGVYNDVIRANITPAT